MEFGIVSVPTIGTFSLVAMESEFIENRSKISPPVTKISFSSAEREEYNFENLLIDSGFETILSHSIQRVLIDDYANCVSLNNALELDGLGTLQKNGFQEKQGDVFNRYKGLRPLNISPVALEKTLISPVIPTNTLISKPKPKKSETKNYIWPMVLSLLTIFVILFWIYSQFESTSIIKVDIETNASQTENRLNSDNQNYNDTMLGASEPVDSAATIDVLNECETVLLTMPNEVLVSPEHMEECVVVVGSFKSETNIKKMLSKINKKGYKVYTQEVNGLSRVGVAYDCAHNDPDMFKSKIKSQFNKDAWHLHDTLKK